MFVYTRRQYSNIPNLVNAVSANRVLPTSGRA